MPPNNMDRWRELVELAHQNAEQAPAPVPAPPPEGIYVDGRPQEFRWARNYVVGNLGGLQQAVPGQEPPWARPIQHNPFEQPRHPEEPQPVPPMPDPKRIKIDYKSISEKSTRLPRFKMKYENIEEMTLRLKGSIITLRDSPHYVREVSGAVEDSDTGERGPGYLVQDKEGKLKYIVHDEHGCNLRTPDPGYVTIAEKCYYIYRIPARVYKQGLCQDNSVVRRAYGNDAIRLWNHDAKDILKGLDERPVIRWPGKFPVNHQAHDMRLSDRVAVVRRGSKYFIHYKGGEVGHLEHGGKVKLPEENYWITRAFNAVGVETVL